MNYTFHSFVFPHEYTLDSALFVLAYLEMIQVSVSSIICASGRALARMGGGARGLVRISVTLGCFSTE